jgi:hypothetical protein
MQKKTRTVIHANEEILKANTRRLLAREGLPSWIRHGPSAPHGAQASEYALIGMQTLLLL